MYAPAIYSWDIGRLKSRWGTSTAKYVRTHVRPARSVARWKEERARMPVASFHEITFRNRFFHVGNAYRGEMIALRRVGELQWDVYHCWKQLGTVDMSLQPKKKGRYHSIK